MKKKAAATTTTIAAIITTERNETERKTSAHIWNIFTKRKFITVFYEGGHDLRFF